MLRNDKDTWINFFDNIILIFFTYGKSRCEEIFFQNTYSDKVVNHHDTLSATISFMECKKTLFIWAPIRRLVRMATLLFSSRIFRRQLQTHSSSMQTKFGLIPIFSLLLTITVMIPISGKPEYVS